MRSARRFSAAPSPRRSRMDHRDLWSFLGRRRLYSGAFVDFARRSVNDQDPQGVNLHVGVIQQGSKLTSKWRVNAVAGIADRTDPVDRSGLGRGGRHRPAARRNTGFARGGVGALDRQQPALGDGAACGEDPVG